MSKVFLGMILSILIMGCTNTQSGGIDLRSSEASSSNGGLEGDLYPNGILEVWFSEPIRGEEKNYLGGPDEELVAAIDNAKITIDMAIYNLNLWSIRDALIDAHQRGVQIRMVMESENLNDEVPQDLILAGIDILGDRRESLMHHKFMIIDREDVWTGSMNFTVGSAYFDYNNLLKIHSIKIAEDYLVEFEEMYEHDLFGDNSVANTPYPHVVEGSITADIYFSPEDNVASQIINMINNADESIYFMAYSFTSDAIGDAIINRSNQGIIVKGLMDEGQIASNTGTEFNNFKQANIDLRIDQSDGLMHHKVIVIDHQIVITGSYNFSSNAEERNDENIIVIYDEELAAQYIQEFERILTEIEE